MKNKNIFNIISLTEPPDFIYNVDIIIIDSQYKFIDQVIIGVNYNNSQLAI